MDPHPQRAGMVFAPLTQHAVERLFAAADALLERVGIALPDDPESLAHFDTAGARISHEPDGPRVRFPPGLAGELIRRHAPATFCQHARNPQRTVTFGTGDAVFAPASGPPFVRDRVTGRRRHARMEDFEHAARLTQASAVLNHAGGGYCEPGDRDPATRHLDMLLAKLTLTDKPISGAIRDAEQIRDSFEMARIAAGRETLDDCLVLNLLNLEPPLVLTGPVAEGIRLTAEAGQAALIASYSMQGMTSPVTAEDALVQMLAEIQAGAALAQIVRPGTPVICGIYAVPFSMSTMGPVFGAIESAMIMAAGAQLVRELGVPFRADGAVTTAKCVDAQAGRDTALGLGMARAIGADYVLHTAGWLESGLVFSFEKFAHDVAALAMLQRDGGAQASAPPSASDTAAHTAWPATSPADSPPLAAGRHEWLLDYVRERRRIIGGAANGR